MCFSAEASFTGAIVIGSIGCLTLSKVTKGNQLFLAFLPFIFAFQQLIEGFLWVSTKDIASYVQYAPMLKNIYLFIAIAVWPIWIPLSFLAIETQRWNRHLLSGALAIGIFYVLLNVYEVNYVWSLDEITINVINHSIQYQAPVNSNIYLILYTLAVLLPAFLSSWKGTTWLGIISVVGFAAAEYLYSMTFVSVWCFFAAWASISVYFILKLNRQLDSQWNNRHV